MGNSIASAIYERVATDPACRRDAERCVAARPARAACELTLCHRLERVGQILDHSATRGQLYEDAALVFHYLVVDAEQRAQAAAA